MTEPKKTRRTGTQYQIDRIARKGKDLLDAATPPMAAKLQKGLKWSYPNPNGPGTLIDFEIVDVDPAMAAMFLTNQRRNRQLQHSTVTKYVSDLKNGRWMPNLECMWLDKNLALGDGLHRCSAIVESGVTMYGVLVAIAYDDDIFASLDQGKLRTMENIQRISGDEVMNRTVSGAVILEHNNFKSAKRNLQSIAERREILQKFKLTEEMNSLLGGTTKRPTTVPAMAVAIRTIRRDKDVAWRFWNAVFTNNAMIDGTYSTVANALSTWLYANARNTGEAARSETLYRCIYAWNAFKTKKNIKIIRYVEGADLPEVL